MKITKPYKVPILVDNRPLPKPRFNKAFMACIHPVGHDEPFWFMQHGSEFTVMRTAIRGYGKSEILDFKEI